MQRNTALPIFSGRRERHQKNTWLTLSVCFLDKQSSKGLNSLWSHKPKRQQLLPSLQEGWKSRVMASCPVPHPSRQHVPIVGQTPGQQQEGPLHLSSFPLMPRHGVLFPSSPLCMLMRLYCLWAHRFTKLPLVSSTGWQLPSHQQRESSHSSHGVSGYALGPCLQQL